MTPIYTKIHKILTNVVVGIVRIVVVTVGRIIVAIVVIASSISARIVGVRVGLTINLSQISKLLSYIYDIVLLYSTI